MEVTNSFPLRVIQHQRQGMAHDDFFVDFRFRTRFHIDTYSFYTFFDLAAETKLADNILSQSKPLEKTVYIAQGIVVDGDDDGDDDDGDDDDGDDDDGDDDDDEDYEVEDGYYIDWSQSSSASSVTSEGPYRGPDYVCGT
ncbi:hypothetical protein Landi51_13851 [Colletotrichum acutatum]